MIRENVRMAQKFEALVRSDPRFEIPAARHMGMVVFRLKGDNAMTEKLLKKLNSSGKLHAVPASLKGAYVIRFTITSPRTTVEDITSDWALIRATASDVLEFYGIIATRKRVPLKEIKEKNESFGTSLLLANIGPNSPMSPKIVDGSFAALFDNNEVVLDFSKKLKSMQKDIHTNSTRCRVRGMLMSGKQYSLDSRIDLAQAVTDEGVAEAEEVVAEGRTAAPRAGAGRGRSLSVFENSGIENEVGNALRKARQQAIPEGEDEDICTTTILQPHQTQTIRDMVRQLDINLEENSTDDTQQVREAFIEFYKLFDDFGIIDQTSFKNINQWRERSTVKS